MSFRIVTDHGTEQPYLTYADVAARWKCSKATIARYVRAGKLDTIGSGALVRVTLESVLRYEDDTRNRRRAS
jgi:excisionase family DNA binding protein